MAGSVPDATCTLSPGGTVTTVRVGLRCKVTYEFNTEATSAALALPYVVQIDGEVLPEYANKPGALSKETRKIELNVKPGSKVALYLNSDVHTAEIKRHLDRNSDAVKGPQAAVSLADAQDRADALAKRERGARKAWNEELERNEPGLMRNLRKKLEQNESIKQIFDPWYMDVNTADNLPPVPNEQRHSSPNERVHNNHLHITVMEPKIL